MKKPYAVQIAVLLIFLIGLSLVNYFAPERAFSPIENRPLAQRPAFSWDRLFSGEFMKDYETYITDQFAGRDGWTALKSLTERLLGKRENNGVYLCADTLIGRFPEPDPHLISANLQAVDRLCENASIPVYLMLIPSAAEIRKELLPYGAPTADQAAILHSISQATDAQPVDVLSALSAHADQPIFYRTDHHWTSLGACYGADALLRAMGKEGISPEKWTAQTVSSSFFGTLWSKSGARHIPPDSIEILVPADGISLSSFENGVWTQKPLYDPEKLTSKDQYSMFLGGNQPLAVIRTGREGEKLLLLRDSYADCMAPFLTEHFSEIHLIDLRYYRMSISDYIRENGIDRAAVVYGLESFVSDRNIYFMGS